MVAPIQIDAGLLPYATERQREVLQAVLDHGSGFKAAEALGLHRSYVCRAIDAVKLKAAREGYAPGHFEKGTAPGYLMGKVTVQRASDGTVERTWERQSPDAEMRDTLFRQSIEDLVSEVRGLAPVVPPPNHADEDLLVVIPMGDPHFGLLAWAKETGDNFDLEIAERLTVAAVDRLTSLVPRAHTAMLLNLGDYFHADDSTNRTPRSSAPLDVDGRFAKIASVGFRAMVRCINRMRARHRKVIVRCNRGNHDPHQAFMLAMALDAYFHDVPEVEIDMSPASFYYYRFGKVLIGSTHGDGAKLGDLPLLMATDRPEDWAAAPFRYWHCGHVHHDQSKEHPGVVVETHRTLAGKDSWHAHNGYRSGRDMKAIVYHREFGEDTRIRCGVARLEGGQ